MYKKKAEYKSLINFTYNLHIEIFSTLPEHRMIKKTTIIITDLTKEQLLTIPKIIKSEIQSDSNEIQHWSELPFLSRLVIIFNSEEITVRIYNQLIENHPDLKIHLSESILPRHKSFDKSLEAPLSPERELYQEPKPIYEKKAHQPLQRKQTLLESLTLDTKSVSVSNEDGTISPVSPSITLERFDNDN